MLDQMIGQISKLLGTKGGALLTLAKGSFRLLGEENVKALVIARLLFSVICHMLALLACVMIGFNWHGGWGIFLVFVLIFIVYPYSFFYHVRARARQTWFAYAKIANHPNALQEAKLMISQQKWKLRLFAIVELCLRNASSSASAESKSSIWKVFVATALATLQGIYEIAEHYLLPTIVIERVSIPEAAGKLRQLRERLPETLLGSFGYDIVGGVASSVLMVVYSGLLLLAAGLAYFLPKAGMVASEYLMITDDGLALFFFPILCAAILISQIRRMIQIIVSSFQATYFALFYARINRAEELAPELREEVDQFLQTTVIESGR